MSGLQLDDQDRKRDNQGSFFLIENARIQMDLSDDGINSRRSTAKQGSSGVRSMIEGVIRIVVKNHRRIADATMALNPESVATAYKLNLKHIRDIKMSTKITIEIN